MCSFSHVSHISGYFETSYHPVIVLLIFVKLGTLALELGSTYYSFNQGKYLYTYPMTTILKSRIFQPLRRQAPGWSMKPYAIIFSNPSIANTARKKYSATSYKKTNLLLHNINNNNNLFKIGKENSVSLLRSTIQISKSNCKKLIIQNLKK